MRRAQLCCIGIAILGLAPAYGASTFRFDTDPFAGTNVLNVPGRQIVGGEDFVNFDIGHDVFSLEGSVFGVGRGVSFINAPGARLPAGGVNIIVLDAFDDDNNPATPFGAGAAANVIAGHVATSAPGFFIYFNQSLDLPRLVYSTDLSSKNSDLKILARLINLSGESGRQQMPAFTAANFEITNTAAAPDTSTVATTLPGLLMGAWLLRRKRRKRERTAAQQS